MNFYGWVRTRKQGNGHWHQWVMFSALVLLSIAGPAFAQLSTGTIVGTVKYSSGGVVAGSTVAIKNIETGQSRTIATGDDGAYRVPALPVGGYEVTVSRAGFQTATRKGLTLTVSQEAVVDFTLQVGSTGQTVVVTEEAPQINTTSGSLGGLVSEQVVSDLPLNGRNYADLSLLQAGITQQKNLGSTGGTGGTWYSSNGAPPRSNNYTLDGAVLVNFYGGTASSLAGTTLGVDGIREYKVVTNAFSAEYGLAMGSQMIIVSKGGSNQFHGDVFEFLRNASLDARNALDESYTITGKRLPQHQRNNFGGAFGGPIKKDKTFFYGVYEGLREHLGTVNIMNTFSNGGLVIGNPSLNCFNSSHNLLLTGNPCAITIGNPTGAVAGVVQPFAQLLPYPNLGANQYIFPFVQNTGVNYGQMRVDHTFSASDNMFGRYTIEDTTLFKPASTPYYSSTWLSRNQWLTLSESHVFSPTLLNSARVSFSRTNLYTSTLGNAAVSGFSYLNNLPWGGISVTGVNAPGGPGCDPGSKIQDVYQAGDDIFWTKGKHAFKFGVLFNRYEQASFDSCSLYGTPSFSSIANFLSNSVSAISVETPGQNNMNRNFLYNTFGAYVQDDYRLSPRVTVNLGVRYEIFTQPRETNGRSSQLSMANTAATTFPLGPVINPPRKTNFSPRIGLAWDVFGNGKTSVRSGFGLYYDIANIGGIFVQEELGDYPISSITTWSGPFTYPLTIPSLTACVYPNCPNIRGADFNMKQPHLLQYNLTVEQQLPGAIALSVAYVGTRGINLYQVKDGNPCKPNSIGASGPVWNVPCGLGRVNPNFSGWYQLTAGGDSWYNALQVVLTKRTSHGLEFQSAYTYSKSLDTMSGMLTSEGTGGNSVFFGIYPENPRLYDKGPSIWNGTHNWRFNMMYHIPNIKSDNFAAKIEHGWWMGNIVSLQSGYPFTVVMTTSRSNEQIYSATGGIDRPDRVTSANLAAALVLNPKAVVYDPGTVITGNPNQWYNPNMFTLQTAGTLGNAGRNTLNGPGFSNWDFSINKDTGLRMLGENGQVQFRAEIFNALNHANYALPSNTIFNGSTATPVATAGVITSTVNFSRQIQFALKVIF